MAVPALLLTLATLLCASAAPAREVLFAASQSESIDARSGAGLVSPWSGADPPTTTRQQVARLRVEAAAARGITVTGLVLMALGGGVTVMKKLAAA